MVPAQPTFLKFPPTAVNSEVLKSSERAKIKLSGVKKAIFPIEISARILNTAREMAESHFKRDVKKVVLTVPECFTEQQKNAGGSQLLLWAVHLLLITRLKRTVANAFVLAGSRLLEDTLPVFG